MVRLNAFLVGNHPAYGIAQDGQDLLEDRHLTPGQGRHLFANECSFRGKDEVLKGEVVWPSAHRNGVYRNPDSEVSRLARVIPECLDLNVVAGPTRSNDFLV